LGLVVLLAAGCNPPQLNPNEASMLTVAMLSKQAITAIKNKDFTALANLVDHAGPGLRFSPYTFVTNNDQVFTKTQVQSLLTNRTQYLWGYAAGSGAPINLTFTNYYPQFVYSKDFANAPQVSATQPIGHGNMVNNVAQFYNGSITVEYHFPGFDPTLQGMDWQSLKLVFQQKNNSWYLVGVVHDQWTP
jgi:hypothetical protein